MFFSGLFIFFTQNQPLGISKSILDLKATLRNPIFQQSRQILWYYNEIKIVFVSITIVFHPQGRPNLGTPRPKT